MIDPKAEMHYEKGCKFSLKKKYEDAIKEFDKALTIDPIHADAYTLKGRLKYYLKDYKGAIKDLDKALIYNAEKSQAYYYRFCAKFDSGNKAGADKDLKTLKLLAESKYSTVEK